VRPERGRGRHQTHLGAERGDQGSSERDQEQQEAQHEHDPDHQGCGLVELCLEVEVLHGGAVDLGAGRQGFAELVDGCAELLVGGGDRRAGLDQYQVGAVGGGGCAGSTPAMPGSSLSTAKVRSASEARVTTCSLTAAMLRYEAGRDPLNEELTALVGELSMRSQQFRKD